VSRQDLIDRVKDAFVTDTSLAEAVSALRQILGDEPQSPSYIQTVHRRGYRFVAPVEARGRPPGREVDPAATPDEVVSPSIGGQLLPSLAILSGLLAAIAVFQLTHRLEPAPVCRSLRHSARRRATLRQSRSGSGARARRIACRVAACGGSGCLLYVRPLDRLDAIVACRGPKMPRRRSFRQTVRGLAFRWRKAQESVAVRRSTHHHR
jgi:hypothetical protein